MILATRQANGKVNFFDAKTGLPMKKGRKSLIRPGTLPDYALRFLSPAPKTKPTPMGSYNHTAPAPVTNTIILGGKKSKWAMFVEWLKSLIHAGK